MKKLVLSTFCFLSFASISFAQILFGPQLGLGLSNIKRVNKVVETNEVPYDSYSYIVVPQVGVVLNAQLGRYLALRPELFFTQKGTVEKATTTILGNSYTFKTSIRASYVELPIKVVGCLPLGPGQVELFAGPSFGYVIGGNVKSEYFTFNQPKTNEGKVIGRKTNSELRDPRSGVDLYLNPFNVSLNLGASYKFNNGLLIQLGYNLGLSNINAHSTNSEVESKRNDRVSKWNSFTLGISYLFGGKK